MININKLQLVLQPSESYKALAKLAGPLAAKVCGIGFENDVAFSYISEQNERVKNLNVWSVDQQHIVWLVTTYNLLNVGIVPIDLVFGP